MRSVFLFLAAVGAACAPSDVEPDVVARVNGEPITRTELDRKLAAYPKVGLAERAAERQALQGLIQRRLLLKEAIRRHLTITDEDLDAAVAALRRRFDDLESFGMWMKAQDLDDRALFETVRADLLVARVAGALVAPVTVSGEQVDHYYLAHKEDLRTEEVRIQVIAVSDAAAAEEIQAAIRNGEDFGRLARRKSRGIRASRGGDVGWIDAATLWPPMREAVRTLQPGKAIGPLARGDEFLVVRLHERRPGRTKTLEEARREVTERLLAQAQQDILQAWLESQEMNSRIEVLLPATGALATR